MNTRITNNNGTLYIIATPIGNLDDISLRAIDTLKQVDQIAAEDTRHSKRLLQHFNISTPLIAYHDHTDKARTAELIAKLENGQSIGLISDAGTPLISDPGYRLVVDARCAGIPVVPIPGACALVAALSVSGLPSDRWAFEGFLPAKSQARQQALSELVSESRTIIFYESTHRILDCLRDIVDVFGAGRQIVICRELTKTFETVLSGSASEVLAQVKADNNQQKGEFVVLVEGFRKGAKDLTIDANAEKTLTILLEELPIKQAAAIAAKLTGLKKRDLYQWALSKK